MDAGCGQGRWTYGFGKLKAGSCEAFDISDAGIDKTREAAEEFGENFRVYKKNILDDLLFRIQSVQRSKNNKYILLNAPNDKLDKIVELLPGMKSPTIIPLYEKGWSSLHSVINENEFWEVINKLKEYGAQGILVTSIEKMII